MDNNQEKNHAPSPAEALSLATGTESMELDLLPAADPVQDASPSPFASFAAVDATDAPITDNLQPEELLVPRQASSGSFTMARSSSLLLRPVVRSGVEVFTFGRGDFGQLGDGTTADAPEPHAVHDLKGKDVVEVAVGAFHTAVLTADGEVYAWGANDDGQCAARNKEIVDPPARVEALESFRIGAVACGSNHTVAVADEGGVFAFGAADYGQLALGELPASKIEHPKASRPLRDAKIARVAAGGRHTLFLEASGAVLAAGDASSGALGLGPQFTAPSAHSPLPLLRLWPLGVVQIAAGDAHSAAVTIDGNLFTWGRGRAGALGLGDFFNALEPVLVRGLVGKEMVQVACGGDHTLALTASGEVFSWGQGKWGATGLGHADSVCAPQRVGKLEGERVVQAAAGGRHTLFLTDANEVWACGVNAYGQCGPGEDVGGCVLAPRRVLGLSSLQGGGKLVLSIAAGGDHSAALVQQQKGAMDGVEAGSSGAEQQRAAVGLLQARPPPLLQAVKAARAAAARGKDASSIAALRELTGCIERTFLNPAYLIAAVSLPGPQQLDLPAIAEMYQSVLKLHDHGADAVAALGVSCIRLLDTIEHYLAKASFPPSATLKPLPAALADITLLPELAWLPSTLFIVLQNPLASEPTVYGSAIVLRVGRILAVTLPAAQRVPVRRKLQALLQRLPADEFAARCVRPVQRYLSFLASTGRLGASRLEAMASGVLLDVLQQANVEAGGKIRREEFHNQALSSALDLHAEYLAWVRHRDTPSALVSFCQMPFLLTPEAKSHVLHGEAMLQKQQHMSAAAMQAFFQGMNPGEAGFLQLSIRRAHVVEDALTALAVHADDLKKPLRVTFVSGGVPEPAQDEGGVRKEFFQLLVRDLFRPEFGMFTYDEATRTHWFNVSSLGSDSDYVMVGALLGLAIYNGVLLDAHLPLVLYKKLLGGTPDFADLKAAFPDLGRGLQALLDFEPASDVESVFCRSFEVEYDFYGEIQRHELLPNGAAIPVTGENRKTYVDAYTKWALQDSISRQFTAFAKGFLKLCGGPALSMFTPAELELLVCGLPHLDFDGLQKAARYEGGWGESTPAVQWFWKIVQGMSLEQKRMFLAFTTGSDRAPIGGLKSLTLVIQRGGADTERLPTSHTCFNTLLLPEYASKEKMAGRLLTAVQNAQGFGLQ